MMQARCLGVTQLRVFGLSSVIWFVSCGLFAARIYICVAQFSRIQGCGGEEKKRVRDRLCDIMRQGIRRTFFFFFSELFFFEKKKKKEKKEKKKVEKKKGRCRGSIPRPHGWIEDILPVRLDTLWKLHDQYYIWTTTFSSFSSKLQTALSPLGSPPHTPGFYWTWPHIERSVFPYFIDRKSMLQYIFP